MSNSIDNLITPLCGYQEDKLPRHAVEIRPELYNDTFYVYCCYDSRGLDCKYCIINEFENRKYCHYKK